MKRLLLSGFEPFAGLSGNSSQMVVEVVSRLWDRTPMSTVMLPVTFSGAWPRLRDQIDADKPDIVIAFGMAEGRSKIGLEKVAINWIDARIPDNAGEQPVDVSIRPGGPDAIFARLPVHGLAQDLEGSGHAVEVSLSAGSYVCNQVMYQLLSDLGRRGLSGGFVHLPPTEELAREAKRPGGWRLHDLTATVLKLLEAVAQ